MRNKLPLSVSMIAFNEERIIAKSLESIADIASAGAIADSFFKSPCHGTVPEYREKAMQQKWLVYNKRKNISFELCILSPILMCCTDASVFFKRDGIS